MLSTPNSSTVIGLAPLPVLPLPGLLMLMAGAAGGGGGLYSVEWTVEGRVQRVFFRKHTAEVAEAHGITGWVRNTATGTVVGAACGTKPALDALERWLRDGGPPKARVDRAIFSRRRPVSTSPFEAFTIDRTRLPNGKQFA